MASNQEDIRAGQGLLKEEMLAKMNTSQDGCLNSRNEGMAKRDDSLPRSSGGLSGE
jgi:hypothetical protein